MCVAVRRLLAVCFDCGVWLGGGLYRLLRWVRGYLLGGGIVVCLLTLLFIAVCLVVVVLIVLLY